MLPEQSDSKIWLRVSWDWELRITVLARASPEIGTSSIDWTQLSRFYLKIGTSSIDPTG
jgi:hypothetical protein